MTSTNNQQQFMINCNYGVEEVERATVTFILALSAASNNAKTAVFATADAAHLCVSGGTDNMCAEGYDPISEIVEDFIGCGGVIWLCPVCAKAKGITAQDLRPGVEIAGVPRIMEFMASGAQLLA